MSLLLLLGVLTIGIVPNAALYVALNRTRRRLPLCDEEDEEALPRSVLALAFLTECGATLAAGVLTLCGPWLPERRGDVAAGVRIVLVHGFGQTRGALLVLARRLVGARFEVVHFSYAPFAVDVPAAAASLRALVARLQEERPGPVHLLGFGLGGLVARYCVRRHRLPGVRRLMTLGTAHLGTLLAPPWPRAWAALRPGSELLLHLAAADRSPEQFEATAIQSEFDATVLPPDNSYFPAALNVIVRDTGHFSLLFSKRIFALIDENLGAGEVG